MLYVKLQLLLQLLQQLLSICFVAGFAPFPRLWWDIENYHKNTVFVKGKRSASALLLNGTVVKTDLSGIRQGHFLYFNGSNAGFIFNISFDRDQTTTSCFLSNNTLCKEFTFAFWAKWYNWGDTFVIASPALRMEFHSETHFAVDFITENQQWFIITPITYSNQWDFYSIVFNTTCLQLSVNAVVHATKCDTIIGSLTSNFAEDVLGIGLPLQDFRKRDAEMCIDDIMIWNRALKISEVESAFKYEFKDVKAVGCSTSLRNKDRYLIGFIIQETKLQSLEECLSFCLEKEHCKSFNFEYKSTEKRKKCVVNSSRSHDAPLHLIKDDGYYYYDIE